ncbi:N-acyl-L-amino acid amidohydrolase [Mizugakiibacter sediminis]|uniref:N-acyl-L-amino acid amidohydrolase n=1 Tax=Mizugakiibacter sediminis TaxID=1475481 RepID=A0A0K8QIX2_9GAMM|nr:amidohydrolase [Mizugakiibacter sediminis]GAP64900.1 N-acyl-L-amino acid amidohydrolase [Mizugakiibacter sediminis]
MRASVLAVAVASLLAAAAVRAGAAADTVADAVRQELPQVTAWRRDIHQHPELSNRETRTAALVAKQLQSLGLEVRTGIAHTGVVGILRGGRPGPKLALRADMDALPVTEEVDLPFASKAKGEYRGKPVGVMHACGHDAHTAMLLGVATALAGMKRDLPGEVMFVFQPAEEGAPAGERGGASLMLDEGLFGKLGFKPDAMFGLHVVSSLNVGEVAVRPGPAMAGSDWFRMVVHGRQTHGAMPWNGVDPIVAAAEIVTAAQTIVSRKLDISTLPAVLSFGIIEGGARYNIVPDQVELQGTIRTFDDGMRRQVFDNLKAIAEHVAAANGATVDAAIPYGESNPVLVNDPALEAKVKASLVEALGAAHVHEAKPWMASEDFAYFARAVPSVYFFVGATPAGQDPAAAPANHSPKFFLDEGALGVGMRAMLQATLDYLRGAPAGA